MVLRWPFVLVRHGGSVRRVVLRPLSAAGKTRCGARGAIAEKNWGWSPPLPKALTGEQRVAHRSGESSVADTTETMGPTQRAIRQKRGQKGREAAPKATYHQKGEGTAKGGEFQRLKQQDNRKATNVSKCLQTRRAHGEMQEKQGVSNSQTISVGARHRRREVRIQI